MKTEISIKLEHACLDFGILAIWVFGSRASEIAGLVNGRPAALKPKNADVDVGVLYPRGIIPDGRSRVRTVAALEDLFHVDRVDLIVLGEAAPFLAVDVIKGELLIDLSPRDTAEFELYALRRAADLLPFRRERTAAVLDEGAR